MNAYAKAGLFNGTVLVMHHNKIMLHKGYGMGNYRTRKSNNTRSRYQIYSITKPITATMVLMLVEQGKLKLSDRLAQFYPTIPGADSITIEHLLTHTSGLYPYNNDGSMPTQNEDKMIAFLSKRKPAFKPGSSWQYCNTGYYLLGFIIEKLTGLSYEKAITANIFQPLGMHQSGFNFTAMQHPDKTTGYTMLFYDTARKATLFPQHELFAAGGIWSTSGDLLKFHKAIQQHTLISQTTTAQAYTVFKSGYGYGWFTDSVHKQQVVSHSGGAPGFRTYLVRIEATNTCIIILSNSELTDVTAIKNNLLKLLFNEPYYTPLSQVLNNRALARIAGVYRFDADRSIYITQAGHHLLARVSGQTPNVLVAQNDSVFHAGAEDISLSFRSNRNGIPDTLLLVRRQKLYKAHRITASWGITGSSLPGGWDAADTFLQQDSTNSSRWKSHPVKLSAGVFKFRFNSDWTYNYGTNNLQNGTLVEGGEDITVAKDGVYIVVLDFSNPDKAFYRLILQ